MIRYLNLKSVHGKEALTVAELQESNIKYTFKDGSAIVVSPADMASASFFKPKWDL